MVQIKTTDGDDLGLNRPSHAGSSSQSAHAGPLSLLSQMGSRRSSSPGGERKGGLTSSGQTSTGKIRGSVSPGELRRASSGVPGESFFEPLAPPQVNTQPLQGYLAHKKQPSPLGPP